MRQMNICFLAVKWAGARVYVYVCCVYAYANMHWTRGKKQQMTKDPKCSCYDSNDFTQLFIWCNTFYYSFLSGKCWLLADLMRYFQFEIEWYLFKCLHTHESNILNERWKKPNTWVNGRNKKRKKKIIQHLLVVYMQ